MVRHLNAGTMCPVGQRLVEGTGSVWRRGRLVCHCLLVETRDGLVLVDTGLGTSDVARPRERLGRLFTTVVRPALRPEETAVAQIVAMGHQPEDVRHVVPTHLDVDHAGGLCDFPHAIVHVHGPELDAALARATARERGRYRPAMWDDGPRWERHAPDGERWHGFDAVRAVGGTGDRVLLVPLAGHTRGHCGVAVETSAGWVLHAGDAYFHRDEMDPASPRCPVGLRLFQRIMAADDAARRRNQERLRDLAREHVGSVRIVCAHDRVEIERAA